MSNISERGQQLSSSQQVLLALKEARARLEAIEKSRTEPIAIIGMGCRFPGGANDPTTFWQLLRDGVDAITEVPPDRWNVDAYYDPDPEAPGKTYTRHGGFLQQVDQFDPQFFGISPREAVSMDPQQRLLLEVSWEALENAGQTPRELRCSQTGVFMGICTDDYAQLSLNFGDLTSIDAYSSLGNTRSIAVGRIAYTLGLQGPNIQLDTACSSSLVTVHLAIQSLRSGECNLALAGGVNLILSPIGTINRSKLKALSPDGRCKTFDASANGYAQGEGCGIVVLKRLSDAVADGDNILALIRGSAVNHDGPSSGLTVPNELAQEKVIRQALKNAKLEPAQVSYVEAHGTGTSLGDPIEVGALGSVFGKERPQNQPLAIGSVKTNFGHLEAAAGIGCLIKVVLALQHKEIPPSLHFKQPNPHIPWDELPIVVPTSQMSWTSESKRRIAGVSSFGISGTNAHVVLSEAPATEPVPDSVERPLHLLTLSAKTQEALNQLAERYYNHLAANPTLALGDICFSANTGRSHFHHRLSAIATSTAELRENLAAFTTGLFSGQVSDISQHKIAFLFTGQGSQYVGMGRQLYEQAPTYRQTLDLANEILRPYLEQPLLEVLYPEPGMSSPLDETAYTQPALFALEYALFQLWKSWGITPDVVMGHSVGEYVAACVAGVFSLEDGLKLIALRARLMQALPQDSEMVAVLAGEGRVTAAIQAGVGKMPALQELSIAAINGPQSIAISGKRQAVEAAIATMDAVGVKTKKLKVSHAFHSPLMKPMLAAFERVAKEVTYSVPQLKIISNVTGGLATAEIATPEYWLSHVLKPVRFADGMETLHQQGYSVFVEVGPKPTLLGMGRTCLPEGVGVWLPSLRQAEQDWQQLLSSLAALYERGVTVDWSGFDRDYQRRRVQLPTYPFQRQRYWIETAENHPKTTGLLSQDPAQTPIVKLLNQGDTQKLATQLETAGELSEDEVKLLPKLLSFLVKQNQQQLTAISLNKLLYQLEWQPKPRRLKTALEGTQAPEPGSWLIFADQSGMGQALAELLQFQGQTCILVYPGDAYKCLETGIWSLNPASPDDFERLFQEVWATSKLPLWGVVHLWSLEADRSEELSIPCLEQAQQYGCACVLHLVQMLVKHNRPVSPRLWLVTQGAQPVESPTSFLAVAQAPVWGLGKVVALEHPELWGGMLDLAPDAALDAAKTLLAEIWDSEGEDHLAFRRGQRYVARLMHSSLQEPQVMRFRSDGSYLITGGLGALGLKMADWMVEQGAQHLILTGRRGASGVEHEAVSQLEQAGAQVLVVQADVSKQSDVAKVLEQGRASMPPLRGIVHAAGVLDDGVLLQQNWERFTRVMTPKVKGAWNLHVLTQDMPLDFFVCFSSAASLLGSPGQGNYAAANAFMDALAHYRSHLGLPGLSINWGPWAASGMAAELGSRNKRRIADLGLGFIAPEQGLQVLAQLLTTGVVQVGVVPVNWPTFIQQFPLGAYPAFISELAHQVGQQVKDEQPQAKPLEIRRQLEESLTGDRHEILTAYLQEQVAKALGLSASQLDVQQPLNGMGLDSLAALELRNRVKTELGVDVPVVKFLEGFSIASLAMQVIEQLTAQSNSSVSLARANTQIGMNKGVHPEDEGRISQTAISDTDWIEGEL